MDCPKCQPGARLGYVDYSELAAAHVAAGYQQTKCPGCGLYRWPWEWPAPTIKSTGLRWFYNSDESWSLRDENGTTVGRIVGLIGAARVTRHNANWHLAVYGKDVPEVARKVLVHVLADRGLMLGEFTEWNKKILSRRTR